MLKSGWSATAPSVEILRNYHVGSHIYGHLLGSWIGLRVTRTGERYLRAEKSIFRFWSIIAIQTLLFHLSLVLFKMTQNSEICKYHRYCGRKECTRPHREVLELTVVVIVSSPEIGLMQLSIRSYPDQSLFQAVFASIGDSGHYTLILFWAYARWRRSIIS